MNKYTKQILNEDMKWISIDLDLTLASQVWPEKGIGAPLSGAVESMQQLKELGYKVMIYTARAWDDYLNIENWLNDNNMPFKRIICGKPMVKYHIDDRNIEFKNNWPEIINKLTNK